MYMHMLVCTNEITVDFTTLDKQKAASKMTLYACTYTYTFRNIHIHTHPEIYIYIHIQKYACVKPYRVSEQKYGRHEGVFPRQSVPWTTKNSQASHLAICLK